MLSSYGKGECITIGAIGLMVSVTALILNIWWLAVLLLIAMVALLAFFRDPERKVPAQRGQVVSPADGKVSSIHEVEHFEPLGEKAICVRIFLSVLDVHVNRSPCHAIVQSVSHKPGQHLNALNPQSAEDNESVMMVLVHPNRKYPLCAVRQVAGLIARTIVCSVREGQILQRGQRYGMIKFGSTAEVYLPESTRPEVLVRVGERVSGGSTVLARIAPVQEPAPPSGQPATDAD